MSSSMMPSPAFTRRSTARIGHGFAMSNTWNGKNAAKQQNPLFVIPAKAGTHPSTDSQRDKWVPAFAGTTKIYSGNRTVAIAWAAIPSTRPDIGLRMAEKARAMGNRDTTDHDMAAGPEAVDIDALADPHIAEPRHQEPLGSGEILRRRHLQIVLAAGHHDRRDPGRLGNRRVVGQHVP